MSSVAIGHCESLADESGFWRGGGIALGVVWHMDRDRH
jgi:hypothetical protein